MPFWLKDSAPEAFIFQKHRALDMSGKTSELNWHLPDNT